MGDQEIRNIIGRKDGLFESDMLTYKSDLANTVSSKSFLVLGGAGSIGKAVVKEIFKRNPIKLHVVDISENNLVELVREIRSTLGYIEGDFKTYALDIGSTEYDTFIESDGKYDYVLNLSALKHVRSEKDPYTLMRMINVNIFNTVKNIEQSIENKASKYFCVSTDKAANPVNMMGASKRIMEMFLNRYRSNIAISSARFANVAFSDGSLLHGFNQRIEKRQPIVAPNDVKRYFVTPTESGQLCLMSAIYGENGDIFFPKLNDNFKLTSFVDIAKNFLKYKGYEPYLCRTEEEARQSIEELASQKKWPCLFTESDTTGEKSYEEFFTEKETLDLKTFNGLGVIKGEMSIEKDKLNTFENSIQGMLRTRKWNKENIVSLFFDMIPNFSYEDKGKYLESKM